MSAPLFTLDATVTSLFQNGVDTLITTLGRPCNLYLPGALTQCPNCFFNPLDGNSSGVYNGGGPRSFTRPPCPVCRGSGYNPTTSQTIVSKTFLLNRDPKVAKMLNPTLLTRPGSVVFIKGFMTDATELRQMEYLIIDPTYAATSQMIEKYILVNGTEPSPQGNIIPGRYFTAFLQKIE